MGTFHVFIKHMLDSGASVTIHCYCLRAGHWTNEYLAQFPATLRLWNVTQDYRCAGCGRIGMVRDLDILPPPAVDPEPKREYVRRAIPIKDKPSFGKRGRKR
jgi:hypothetical protein